MRSLLACFGTAAVVIATTLAAAPAQALDDSWTSVGTGSVSNISGIAVAGSGWVVVRDNKKAGQNRVALVDDNAVVTNLAWPGAQPTDLEAIDAVPGTAGQFVAVSSSGTGWLLRIEAGHVSVVRSFVLPGALQHVEGFALSTVGGSMVAVWANRGSAKAAAKVRAATFSPGSASFGPIAKGTVKVGYPTANVRQVSDLKVVAGRVIISSASDPGVNGPFASALYDAGTVTLRNGRVSLGLNTVVELGRFAGHKVEGIACAGSVGVLGSDDEKAGGAIRAASFCPTPG